MYRRAFFHADNHSCCLSVIQGTDPAQIKKLLFLDLLFYHAFFRRADSRISADSESASDGYHLGADSPYGCSCLQHCTYAEFFRGIPRELEEAALIDGANQFQTCFRIYVPCAKPSIATLTLFCFITHWNSYFDGLIFSNFPESYPLASFLYTVVVQRDMSLLSMEQIRELSLVDDRTIRCAQIFIALIPIMLIYPFAQKYFVKGMTVGSVKG